MISPSQKRLVASLVVGAFIFLARPINALAEATFVYTFNDAINLTLDGPRSTSYTTFIPVTPNILNADAHAHTYFVVVSIIEYDLDTTFMLLWYMTCFSFLTLHSFLVIWPFHTIL